MSIRTLTVPHLPPDLRVYVAQYTGLENAQFLRSQLLAGNLNFEYAFIDATTIISTTHLLAAIFRASNDWTNKRIRTRNIHSEIVYCLGYTNNIATTLKTFGISESTKEFLAVKVSCQSLGLNVTVDKASVEQHLSENVKGTLVDYDDMALGSVSDIDKIRKIYKLSSKDNGKARRRKDGTLEGALTSSASTNQSGDHQVNELEMQILGLMAIRGYA